MGCTKARVVIVDGGDVFPSSLDVDLRVWMDVAAWRPDDADVLFVPVGGMVPPIRIRFMPEVGCDVVLWDDENGYLGELEDLLPMSEDLREQLKAWADRHYQVDSGSLSLSDQALGTDDIVQYAS